MHVHGWKVRLFVGMVMLLMGFIGLIVTDIMKDGAWSYWRITAVVYALLSLVLSWHLKRTGWRKELVTVWQEILHWGGLMLAIALVSYIVSLGLQGRYVASLQVLTLLALATYLAGVYFEPSFIPIGIVLGLFAAGLAFFNVYLYGILVPVTIVAGGVLYWMNHRFKSIS